MGATVYSLHNFKAQEFLPPTVHQQWGDRGLMFMDDRVLVTADQLREYFGPMTVNNWHFWKPDAPHWSGDLRRWSGLRVKGCPHGTAFSQHRFGRAVDAVFRDATAEEVRQVILKNPDWFPFITAMEAGTSWLHFDVRNCTRITMFNP